MRRYGWLFLLAATGGACTEQATAPGDCPNFCPGGQILIKDTVFTDIVERDSSFAGYVKAYQATAATAATLPSVTSRPIFVTRPMILRIQPVAADTTTVPIIADSSRLRVSIVKRNRPTTNIVLKLFSLPATVDSSSDFASLDTFFSGPALDSVNVSALLASPAIGDSATIKSWGDSIRTDSAGHVLIIARSDSALLLYFSLDTLKAPLSVSDSGRVGFGVAVTADSLASVRLGTNESVSNGAVLEWFFHYTSTDSAMTVKSDSAQRASGFDSYVFDPPNAAVGSDLTIGGAPSVRSLLRVALPTYLHDSVDVVRGTLVLIPIDSVPGTPADSFQIFSRPVLRDFGAKSPLVPSTFGEYATTTIHPGTIDTVRIEVTNMVRDWVADTSRTTAVMLSVNPEAVSYQTMRFYSSRTPAFRPTLHVTYVKRFSFGAP